MSILIKATRYGQETGVVFLGCAGVASDIRGSSNVKSLGAI